MINIEVIRDGMESLSLTTAALADICPVPKSTLERILSGSTANPGVQTVADIAAALHLSMDEIMGISPPAASAPSRPSPYSSLPSELSGYYRATIRELRTWLARVSVVCVVLVIYNMFRWMLAFFLISFVAILIVLLAKIILPAVQKHRDK